MLVRHQPKLNETDDREKSFQNITLFSNIMDVASTDGSILLGKCYFRVCKEYISSLILLGQNIFT